MFRKAAQLFIAVFLVAGAAQVAWAKKRVALVIGNSNYSLARLNNPKNDADDVAAALRRLQFEVAEEKDLTTGKFDDAIDAFEKAAKDADVALFFFSGHGVQIDRRGFIAPVNFKAESESSALRELVAIQEVVARIENAAKTSVIVLDACRDSPLQERLRRVAVEKNRDLIPPKGLPSVTVRGSNTLVVYAAAPGETASDGPAQRNSPFTAALLKNIETPDLEIELMFKQVTADVLNATGGKQQPERLSRLQSVLVLAPAKAPSPETLKPIAPFRPEDACVTWTQRHLVIGNDLQSRRFMLEPAGGLKLMPVFRVAEGRSIFHRRFSLFLDVGGRVGVFLSNAPRTCLLARDESSQAVKISVFFVGRPGESLDKLKDNAEDLAFAPSAPLNFGSDFPEVSFHLRRGGFDEIQPFFLCGRVGLLVCERSCPADIVTLAASLINEIFRSAILADPG